MLPVAIIILISIYSIMEIFFLIKGKFEFKRRDKLVAYKHFLSLNLYDHLSTLLLIIVIYDSDDKDSMKSSV